MLLLVSAALAEAPYSDVSEGWYLFETGRVEAANDRAVEALHLDPTDVAAHRLYVNVRVKGFGEGEEVVEQYRDWVAQDPDDAAARIGLANALQWTNRDMGPWCEELAAALDPLPEDPIDRYWALRVQLETRRTCPGLSEEEAREQLLAHEAEDLFFEGYRLRVQLGATKEIDAAWVEALEAWYAAGSVDPGYVGNVWWDRYGGEAQEAAQAAMLAKARELAAGDEPLGLHNAAEVLGWAELDDEEEAVRARLDALDPGRMRLDRRNTRSRSWVVRTEQPTGSQGYAIWQANRKAAPRALVALKRLEDEVEATGPERADWHEAMADNQFVLLQLGAELDSLRAAYEADPTPARANSYAYSAALRGEELDEALVAIDGALSAWGDWDPRGPYWVDGYEDWREQHSRELARMLDTRGWLKVQLGDLEGARNDLALAVLLGPEPKSIHHLHLGLVLAELGHDEQALFHLGRGLALDFPELKTGLRAYRTAEALFEAHRWTHEDFDDWVADQLPAEDIGLAPGVEAVEDYRVGMPFPDLALIVDGEDKTFSDYEGLRVVDVWATWCGPCVSSMPHLDEVAEDYAERGVTVLAISVDRELQEVLDFDEGPRRPDYTVAWTGESGWGELRINAIPSVFVVDAEGLVVAHWTGSGGGRLERTLDGLLEED